MLPAFAWGRKPVTFPAIDLRPSPIRRHTTTADSGVEAESQQSSSLRTDVPSPVPTVSSLTSSRPVRTTPIIDNSASDFGLQQTRPAPQSISTASGEGSSKRRRTSRAAETNASGRKHQCSICDQSFARAEHLTRHERAHRNERPFACDYCDTRFTRKDLAKRHVSRHHPNAAGVAQTSPPGEDIAVASSAPSIARRASEPYNDGPMFTSDEDLHLDVINHLNDPQQADPLPAARSDDIARNTEHRHFKQPSTSESLHEHLEHNLPRGSGSFGFLFNSATQAAPHPDSWMLDPVQSSHHAVRERATHQSDLPVQTPTSETASLSLSQPGSSSRRGSTEISTSKRAELVELIDYAFFEERFNSQLKLPSCIGLERYIVSFLDGFLCHFPCIHLPTWNADTAHPILLLSILALGSTCRAERELSALFDRAARLAISQHGNSSAHMTDASPLWLMQSMFFTMAYGTWSGDQGLVQQALSLQSPLTNMVRSAVHIDHAHPVDSELGATDWEDWVHFETRTRTIASIYIYFGMLTLAFNLPPALANSELDIYMPSTEGEWTAPSSQAWAVHRACSHIHIPRFISVLENLLIPSGPNVYFCSTLGLYLSLHALLQQVWYLRQAFWMIDSTNQMTRMIEALDRWETLWKLNDESTLSAHKQHAPLASDVEALSQSAYVRICWNNSHVQPSLGGHHNESNDQSPITILHRTPFAAKAAFYATSTFRTSIKLGLHLPSAKASSSSSLQRSLYSFESCLFLSKWLTVMSRVPPPAWTEDERHVAALVDDTLAEIDMSSAIATRPQSAQVIYAWATMFNNHEIWGIKQALQQSLLAYADSIG